MKLILLIIQLALSFQICAINYGLYFKSHDIISEKRTSLNLTPADEFKFKDGFSLNFDIKLREDKYNYGYVFRIIANDSTSFDLISNFNEKERLLTLVEGDRLFAPFSEEDLKSYEIGTWAKVTFNYKPQSNEVEVLFNGKKITENYSHKGLTKFQIIFGLCNDKKFRNTDVPPVSIRDIRITDEKGNTTAFWPLKEHGTNIVLDSINSRPAEVENPVWEIDSHIKWNKVASFETKPYIQSTYNEKRNELYFVNKSVLLIYKVSENIIDTIFYAKGNPYDERANQIIYNEFTDEIWSYDMDRPEISVYSFETQSWSYADPQLKNPAYSQHNAFILDNEKPLQIFGGYGMYTYRNQILGISNNNQGWSVQNYSSYIPARYLSAAGKLNNDSILVFGGFGNISGRQEMGPKNYYDLHVVDTKNLTTSKLWQIDAPGEDFTVSNAMIIDKESDKFYVLCYPNNRANSYITLKSFDITDGKSETYADTIPYLFNDINTFCTLLYNNALKKLYAVIVTNDNDRSEINIYSLAFPPLDAASIYQKKAETFNYPLLIVFFIIIVILLAIIAIHIYKRNKQQYADDDNLDMSDVNRTTIEGIFLNEEKENFPIKSSISFLGGFQVRDRNGEDITGLFTPTLKQVFILIILYTVKTRKGISHVTFKDTLWFDKSDENAQNNRRVNISKLKLILENLDGITITSENGYWSIRYEEPAFCDYIRIQELVERMKESSARIADITDFLFLAAHGPLLPYIQEEWLDAFKSEYTDHITQVLIELSHNAELQANYKIITRIADIMFQHDSTDEYALKLKCTALLQNGKVGLAKNTFDKFCSEYEYLLGTPYSKTFRDVVSP